MAIWAGVAKRQIAAGIAVLLWAVLLYSGVKIFLGRSLSGNG